jgi:hypothetical protein
MIVLMNKDIFVVSWHSRTFVFHFKLCHFRIELCINNLYSCPPKDDIRCDLACQMLHYVPCQTIQDRRACHILQKHCKLFLSITSVICDYLFRIIADDHSFFHLFEEFKFYIGERVEYFSIQFIMNYFSCYYCYSSWFDWYYCSN